MRALAWAVGSGTTAVKRLMTLHGIVLITCSSQVCAMTTLAMPAVPATAHKHSVSQRALRAAAALWLLVAVVGQLLFLAYVTRLYGSAALDGDLMRWNKVMPHGYVPGDTLGNTVLGMHLLSTVAVLLGGSLQLLPALRRTAPRVHHWVGRTYLLAAVGISLGGLFMMWAHSIPARFGQHLGMSLNAALILTFAGLALRAALARHIDAHRRWALRLYIAVLGVWFFRLGLMLWLLVHRAPVGFDPETFAGPFLTALSFAQTLVPLLILEIYLRAQRSAQPRAQALAAAGLALLTLATAVGITIVYLMMWRPHF
jgi:Predicted membrane protein (DUF2306)